MLDWTSTPQCFSVRSCRSTGTKAVVVGSLCAALAQLRYWHHEHWHWHAASAVVLVAFAVLVWGEDEEATLDARGVRLLKRNPLRATRVLVCPVPVAARVEQGPERPYVRVQLRFADGAACPLTDSWYASPASVQRCVDAMRAWIATHKVPE